MSFAGSNFDEDSSDGSEDSDRYFRKDERLHDRRLPNQGYDYDSQDDDEFDYDQETGDHSMSEDSAQEDQDDWDSRDLEAALEASIVDWNRGDPDLEAALEASVRDSAPGHDHYTSGGHLNAATTEASIMGPTHADYGPYDQEDLDIAAALEESLRVSGSQFGQSSGSGTHATAAAPEDDDREAMKCPICYETFFQPLRFDCGHYFDGHCAKAAFSARTDYHFDRDGYDAWNAHSANNREPYRCPVCRGAVRHPRRDPSFERRLERFVLRNPSEGRSYESRLEASQEYSPGDNIVPQRGQNPRGRR